MQGCSCIGCGFIFVAIVSSAIKRVPSAVHCAMQPTRVLQVLCQVSRLHFVLLHKLSGL
jgi:hypothetical protein